MYGTGHDCIDKDCVSVGLVNGWHSVLALSMQQWLHLLSQIGMSWLSSSICSFHSPVHAFEASRGLQ